MNARSLAEVHTLIMETEKFESALRGAAAKAGIDLSGLKFERCVTDRTWGDRCGVVFFGASAEVNKRAAEFVYTWMAKRPRVSSYDAQSSLSFQGLMSFQRFTNGAGGWSPGALPADPAPYAISTGFVMARTEGFEGFAVNTTYYPCAD